jgi:hypothetical protein
MSELSSAVVNQPVAEELKSDIIFKNFVRLFPNMGGQVLSYQRTGSKMIALNMDDGIVLYFLYYNPTNWNIGTKPWRMKPRIVESTEGTTEEKAGDAE